MLLRINLQYKEDITNYFVQKCGQTHCIKTCSVYTDRPIEEVHKVRQEVRKIMQENKKLDWCRMLSVDFLHDDFLIPKKEV